MKQQQLNEWQDWIQQITTFLHSADENFAKQQTQHPVIVNHGVQVQKNKTRNEGENNEDCT